jgi:uncharacterized protein YkwD
LLRTLVVCSLVGVVLALPAPPAASAGSARENVIAYVNKARAEHGRRALRPSGSLTRSSSRYAAWMLSHDYFGHRSTISASHRFRSLGETIGMSSGWRARWRTIVRMWMRSRTHRRILLSGRFTWIGVGKARGRMDGRRATTWVARVGRK